MKESAHPWWCSPTDCQLREPEGGVHLSRPAQVESGDTGLLVTVQVAQARRIDGYPRSGREFVTLGVRFPDYGPEHPSEEYNFSFDSGLARAVGWMLLRAGRP